MQIRARDLGKTFYQNGHQRGRETQAYAGLDFDVAPGEFLCILGPIGCGKTSLLRTLAGLEKPSSGELHIAPGEAAAPRVGMVFQEHGLFPWMTVRDNVRFLLEGDAQPGDLDGRVKQALADVGLTDFAAYYPHQLSGGMCQRVSIARSFAGEPDILLMDEPFVFLDYQTRLALQALLLDLWRRQRSTVVFVTHDIEEAVLLADRILVLGPRPGYIRREIAVDIPRPRRVPETTLEPHFRALVAEVMDVLRVGEAVEPAP